MAARWAGKDFDVFIELDGEEQSRIIAAYETAMQMEAVLVADTHKRAARKQNTKRRS